MVIIRFIAKVILLAILIALRYGLGSELLKSIVESSNFIKPLLGFLIFLTSINLIIRFSQFIYRKRKKYGHKYSDNVISGLQNIYYLLTAVGVTFMVLGFFGLEPKELLTAISIVAAAIAIISKEQVTDIICGINISFSRDLAIGDYVRLGDQKGIVIDINIHKIVLLNDNDDVIYISNTKAYYSDIVNYTQKEIRKHNLDFSVATAVPVSKKELQDHIFAILEEYKTEVEVNSHNFKIISIEKDSVRYKLQFKMYQINLATELEIKAKILEEVNSLIQAKK
jgi:small-conductance mechanosensitive channel